jgi:predicted lactoylglutathione lyase
LGSTIFKFFEQMFCKTKIKITLKSLDSSIKFYEKLGFIQTHEFSSQNFMIKNLT